MCVGTFNLEQKRGLKSVCDWNFSLEQENDLKIEACCKGLGSLV